MRAAKLWALGFFKSSNNFRMLDEAATCGLIKAWDSMEHFRVSFSFVYTKIVIGINLAITTTLGITVALLMLPGNGIQTTALMTRDCTCILQCPVKPASKVKSSRRTENGTVVSRAARFSEGFPKTG